MMYVAHGGIDNTCQVAFNHVIIDVSDQTPYLTLLPGTLLEPCSPPRCTLCSTHLFTTHPPHPPSMRACLHQPTLTLTPTPSHSYHPTPGSGRSQGEGELPGCHSLSTGSALLHTCMPLHDCSPSLKAYMRDAAQPTARSTWQHQGQFLEAAASGALLSLPDANSGVLH